MLAHIAAVPSSGLVAASSAVGGFSSDSGLEFSLSAAVAAETAALRGLAPP